MNSLGQEPITRGFHLPYLPSESILSRIFLFLEAPHGVFRGCLHSSQPSESCGPLLFTSHAGRTKEFQLCERQRVFAGNWGAPHISQF